MARLVVGTGRFRDVARALRLADASMTRKLRRKITQAVPPLKDAVIRRAPEFLPADYAGALAADLRFTTQTGLAGAEVRVSIKVTAVHNRQVDRIDNGQLRHPLYGNRNFWYTTSVPPGVITKPMADEAEAVRAKIGEAVDEILDEIVRG